MHDQILELDAGVVIHHGKNSNRVYLLSRGQLNSAELAAVLLEQAQQYNYSKVTAKIKETDLESFINAGYCIEGFIPQYYSDSANLFIAAYYLDIERIYENNPAEYQRVLDISQTTACCKKISNYPDITIRQCTPDDAKKMTGVYKKVFRTYPFPIFDEEYIHQTMQTHVDYYCVEINNRLTALASAEIDYQNKAAEMTDFATLSSHRSQGYASRLLDYMEKATRKKNIQTFFTIARAGSYGINITFARAGYNFGGRLKNNTDIAGNIESMNIWYKKSNPAETQILEN